MKAAPGTLAERVLLPGDPARAAYIADEFLEGAERTTDNRGLLGFTGSFKGVRVSVQTTGMGAPSAAIVAEECITLGARCLLRTGTCGATHSGLAYGSLVIATAAVPGDGTTRQYLGGDPYAPAASYPVLEACVTAARRARAPHHVGLIATEDAFYASGAGAARKLAGRGVLAVEMEAAALFTVAALRGVHAGALLTVSNTLGDTAFAPAEILSAGVTRMIKVALEAIVAVDLAPTGLGGVVSKEE